MSCAPYMSFEENLKSHDLGRATRELECKLPTAWHVTVCAPILWANSIAAVASRTESVIAAVVESACTDAEFWEMK